MYHHKCIIKKDERAVGFPRLSLSLSLSLTPHLFSLYLLFSHTHTHTVILYSLDSLNTHAHTCLYIQMAALFPGNNVTETCAAVDSTVFSMLNANLGVGAVELKQLLMLCTVYGNSEEFRCRGAHKQIAQKEKKIQMHWTKDKKTAFTDRQCACYTVWYTGTTLTYFYNSALR